MNDLGEQTQGGVAFEQPVLLDNRLEAALPIPMPELRPFSIKGRRALYLRHGLHVGRRHKQELGVRIDVFSNQPRTGDLIHWSWAKLGSDDGLSR